jgi:hypothetical protein
MELAAVYAQVCGKTYNGRYSMRRAMQKLIVVAGVLLLIASTGFAQTGAKTINPCALLTKAEVQQVLGKEVSDPKPDPKNGAGSGCMFTVGGYGQLSLIARPARADEIPDMMVSEFKKHGVKAEEVKGVGDRAILTLPGFGMVQLNLFKGPTYVILTMMVPGVTEEKAKLLAQKLAEKALSRL